MTPVRGIYAPEVFGRTASDRVDVG